MVRFNDKPQIENSALSDTDIMPITDLEDSASDKKISIGQLKEYLSKNLTNFADIDLVNTDMLADAIIEAPNGIIVANSSNNAIIAKQGLKLLFANGRKANNKFNNLEYTLENDISQPVVSMANGNYVVFLTSAGSLGYIPITEIYISSEQPQVSTTNAYWYDIISNYWKRTSTSGATWVNTIINILGQVTITNNLLTTVTPNTLAYIPIPETLTIRDLSNITTAGEKRIKDLVQPNIDTTVNNASNTINARIDSINSNLQTQISKNRADINTLDAGGAIEKTPSKLKTALLLSTIMEKPISDIEIFNILEQKKRSTFDRSKFTIVGSPTITDDGIASGFSSSNYIRKDFTLTNVSKLELNLCFNCHEITNTYQYLFTLREGQSSGFTESSVTSSGMLAWGTNIKIDLDKNYYLKYIFDNGNYIQMYSTDKINWIETKRGVASYTSKNINNLFIGSAWTGLYPSNKCSIDLKQFSITVDGVEVFNGNKTGIDQIKKDDFTLNANAKVSDDGVLLGSESAQDYLIVPSLGIPNKKFKLEVELDNTQAGYIFYINTDGQTLPLNLYFNGVGQAEVAFNGTGLTDTAFICPVTEDKHKAIFEFDGNTTYHFKLMNLKTLQVLIDKDFLNGDKLTNEFGNMRLMSNENFKIGNLNNFKYYVDDQLVYQPTLRIPYTQSKTDEKIVDATYRDRVQDMYEQFGYTHYYTIGDVPEKYNVEVVGNPTLVGGVASGFSSSNYLNFVSGLGISKLQNNSYRISFEFTTGDLSENSENHCIIGLMNSYYDHMTRIFINPYSRELTVEVYEGSSQQLLGNTIDNFTSYEGEFGQELDGTIFLRYRKKHAENWLSYSTPATLINLSSITHALIGTSVHRVSEYFSGSIDLSQVSITVDGKEVFRGYEPAIVDAYTLATHKNGDIIETFSDNAGTYYEVRADLVQRCVGIIPPQTTQVNYPRAFRDDKNIVQVSYFDVGDSTSTLTLDHIAPKTQTKAGFTIGSTQTANRNYYAEGKAILG